MTNDIELRGVTLRFPRPDGKTWETVYESFDLDVKSGSFTVLLGPSGCGKSTLLDIIDGLRPATEAESICVLGEDIRSNPDATRNSCYVFQTARLLRWKTLYQNVELGMRGLQLKSPDQWDGLIRRYFHAVGLSDYLDHYPHQVSGGMQQRVAIVRAWVNEPRILLMDEPFSHLDQMTAAVLRRELVNLWSREEPRRTVVFVTHDLSEAVELGQRIVMLTSKPARIHFEERNELPYPRSADDDDVFELQKRLTKIMVATNQGMFQSSEMP